MSARRSQEAGHGPILPVSNPSHRVPVPSELESNQYGSYPPPQPAHHSRREPGHHPRRGTKTKKPQRKGIRGRLQPASAPQTRKWSANQATANYTSKDVKGHFIAMCAEFVGTFLFLLFAFAGTQVANTHDPNGTNAASTLMYISASFGLSLLISVWVFYRISGGLFNPAVTFGLMLSGGLPLLRGALLFLPQFLAGIAAAGVAKAMFPGPSLVMTTLGGGTSTAQGFFIEAFATSMLVITVLMLAVEKSKDTFIAPIGVGIALFVAELATVDFTGGSLNPTRSFGPAAVAGQFPGYHWIYWFGPFFGAAMASGFYRFAKALRYEDANPGQDASDDEGPGRATV